jgi:uncharacterized membrane protein
MATFPSWFRSGHQLVLTSLAFGLLGGVFAWWLPVGMILSLAGLVLALIGATFVRQEPDELRPILGAVLVNLAMFVLNCVLAAGGLELVRFPLLG